MNKNILNEDTIVKPWKAEQFIKLFNYLIQNGEEEFIKFASETEYLCDGQQNNLRILEVVGGELAVPTKEKWNEILQKYPNIKNFLENNNMIDRRMLCSGQYFENLFNWKLNISPSLANEFLRNMEKIKRIMKLKN